MLSEKKRERERKVDDGEDKISLKNITKEKSHQ